MAELTERARQAVSSDYVLLLDFLETNLHETYELEGQGPLALLWGLRRPWLGTPTFSADQYERLATQLMDAAEDDRFTRRDLSLVLAGEGTALAAMIALDCVRPFARMLALDMLGLAEQHQGPQARSAVELVRWIERGTIPVEADEFLLRLQNGMVDVPIEVRGELMRVLIARNRMGSLADAPLRCGAGPVWSNATAASFCAACVELALTVYLYAPLFKTGGLDIRLSDVQGLDDAQLSMVLRALHFARFVYQARRPSAELRSLHRSVVNEVRSRYKSAGLKKKVAALDESLQITSLGPSAHAHQRQAMQAVVEHVAATADREKSLSAAIQREISPFTLTPVLTKELEKRVRVHR